MFGKVVWLCVKVVCIVVVAGEGLVCVVCGVCVWSGQCFCTRL